MNMQYQNDRPVRFLQFGEGGFMRAFAEDFVQQMNQKTECKGSVLLVRPRGGKEPGLQKRFREQNCVYHICLQGLVQGNPVRETRTINVVSDLLDPVCDFSAILSYAYSADLSFILSISVNLAVYQSISVNFTLL